MQIDTDGLIIKEQNIGESDRLVTVLTRQEGIVRAFVRGAKKLKSKSASSTQLLCYSRLSIYKGRDKYIIDDAHPEEVFFALRQDIEKLSLAQYFCELSLALAPENGEAGDFLRLMLNALYYLANGKRPALLIKPVVEMRMLSMAGYMPNLICCQECGTYEADVMLFLPRQGVLYCKDCYSRTGQSGGAGMNRGVTTALRHTVYADFNKIFSFSLPDSGQKILSGVSELYLLSRLERGFATLDFYHHLFP
ncbi:MAG: DNA repair protein RecO [Clostridiales bacterium]|jgi:DNA repair protein RecO (recombination protein O)|nr:DNA repair protein RecO [Clostridiales bacterium]